MKDMSWIEMMKKSTGNSAFYESSNKACPKRRHYICAGTGSSLPYCIIRRRTDTP